MASVLVFLGLAPLLWLARETRSRSWRAALFAGWLLGGVAVAASVERYDRSLAREHDLPPPGRPLEVAEDGYVSSRECKACHVEAYESWHDSYHRRMTQVVSPATVQADFANAEWTLRGRTWRLFEQDERYFVEMDLPPWQAPESAADGASAPRPADRRAPERVVRELVMSTGSHHYELFWFTDEDDRKVSLLPFVWRVDLQRWLTVDAAFLVPPDREQGSEGRWSQSCNKCHVTHSKPRNYGRHDVQSQVAEFGIACEACHGPGEAHVAANRDPLARYGRRVAADAPIAKATADGMVDPRELDPVRASMVCGQCHAAVEYRDPALQPERERDGMRYRPGGDFTDERQLRTEGADKFWSDGMIRTSGREYNGLVKSPCYTHGDAQRGVMTCFSCHRMHQAADDPRPPAEWANDQLEVGMDGDRACLQCHDDYATPAAVQAHTHHSATSLGSRCMDCHMPHQTYGLLKAMRSHTVASPSLAETLYVGRPNACNLCHLDQTLEWTGQKLFEWYGQRSPAVPGQGELAADERRIAAGVLWITRGDAGQRALVACAMERPEVRATAGSDWFAPFLAPLLMDPYPAVRLLAERSLRSLPEFAGVDFPYDERASGDALAASAARARALWEAALPPARRRPSATVLIDAEGRFDDATRLRLLSQRDNRRVVLAE